jgi:hypothetical protein
MFVICMLSKWDYMPVCCNVSMETKCNTYLNDDATVVLRVQSLLRHWIWLKKIFFQYYHRLCRSLTGWLSGNAVVLYSGAARFESRLGHRLAWLRICVVFFSLFKQIPGEYLDYVTTSSFQIISGSLFTSDPATRRWRRRRVSHRNNNNYYYYILFQI